MSTSLILRFSGAADVHLTAEEIQQLEEPYQPVKVFGHV